MRELMLFRAGRYRLALPLARVRRVYPAADLRPAAGGNCILDGRTLRLFDLMHQFGDPRPGPEGPRVIWVDVADRPLALRVDGVNRVTGVAEEAIIPLPPAFGERSVRWFPAVVREGAELALLLSPEGMLGIRPSAPAPPSLGPPELAAAVTELFPPDATAETLVRGLRRTLRSGLMRHLRSLPDRLFGVTHR